jgi:hypothetical protein
MSFLKQLTQQAVCGRLNKIRVGGDRAIINVIRPLLIGLNMDGRASLRVLEGARTSIRLAAVRLMASRMAR